MAVYKYFNFSYASGSEQTIDNDILTNPKSMNIINTMASGEVQLSLKAAPSEGGGTSFVLLNKVVIPVGASLNLSQDDLGFNNDQGYILKISLGAAGGSVGITIKY